MSLDYWCGFSLVGQVMNTGSGNVTIGGSFAHLDFSASADPRVSPYTALADAITTGLFALNPSWSCTFDPVALTYTIVTNSSGIALTSAPLLAQALGLDAAVYASASVVSVRRPYYVIRAAEDGRSSALPYYIEPDGLTEEAVADDGTAWGVTRESDELGSSWVQPMEPKEAVYIPRALTSIPWTWQHFFAHLRMEFPFAIEDGLDLSYPIGGYQLIAAAKFAPTPVSTDWDALYGIAIKSRYLGRVP